MQNAWPLLQCHLCHNENFFCILSVAYIVVMLNVRCISCCVHKICPQTSILTEKFSRIIHFNIVLSAEALSQKCCLSFALSDQLHDMKH